MLRLASLGRLLRSLWRRRLGVQVVTALLSASLLLGMLASWINYRIEEGIYRDQLLREGRTLAQAIARTLPNEVLTSDKFALQDYVDDITSSAHIAFAWVQRVEDGKILARSPGGGESALTEGALLQSAPILIERGGDEIGRFVLGMSLRPMQTALRARALALFLQTTLTCLLVAIVLLLVLRRLVIDPLHRLDGEAARLGQGELERPLPAFGDSEIGRLGRTMEEMRGNLLARNAALAARNQRLQELDRLKSQFLANMSHEIRTPIHSILSSVELLQDGSTGPRERGEYLETLRWNGTHLLDLVNTLLDFSKIESGNLIVEPVRCSPIAVVEDALACVRPLAEAKQLRLGARFDGVPPWVATDPVRLRQILINVIGNAVKFTEQGGIDVAVRLLDPGPQQRLELRVTDTGIGMPAQFLGRVFEPFSQFDGSTTRRFGGTGLGLSIARKLAIHLGGDITVTSEVGRGTCVAITVAAPAAELPAPAAAAPAPAAEVPARFCGRVLLVEDARDNQRLMSALLGKAGVQVGVADNGRVAIDQVAAAQGRGEPYDLILMDLQMPEMDGMTAIRWLREHGVKTPIVALTAHALAEDRANCLAAGCDGYETKPIARARLLQVLAQHLPAAAPVG